MVFFINFKVYEEATGQNALDLAKKIEQVSKESKVKIIVALQAADIKEVSRATQLEIWSQHIDLEELGAHTGTTTAEAVKESGALGTFLNHSEHKFSKFNDLKLANDRAKGVNLKTLIFADGINELKKMIKLKPTYVSYEPPELVGSKTTSVAKAKPQVIGQAVTVSKEAGIPLVVGAGIKSEEDIRVSAKLGASGVAVASYVVKSKDPAAQMLNLIKGLD